MHGRLWPSLGSLAFLVLAPGTVAGYVPWRLTGWRVGLPLAGWPVTRAAGWLLMAGGLALLLDCFRRFALEGRGTPAPILPTETLVVSGTYRHVRNPMYVSVVSLILGQAAVLGDSGLVIYGAAVWTAFHLFVVLYEEPILARRHGESYGGYRASVRRWLPRLTPFRPGGAVSTPGSAGPVERRGP